MRPEVEGKMTEAGEMKFLDTIHLCSVPVSAGLPVGDWSMQARGVEGLERISRGPPRRGLEVASRISGDAKNLLR